MQEFMLQKFSSQFYTNVKDRVLSRFPPELSMATTFQQFQKEPSITSLLFHTCKCSLIYMFMCACVGDKQN